MCSSDSMSQMQLSKECGRLGAGVGVGCGSERPAHTRLPENGIGTVFFNTKEYQMGSTLDHILYQN